MNTFKVKIVTPTSLFYEGEVEQLIVRTTEGDVGIWAGHVKYVAAIGTGALRLKNGDTQQIAAISGGFLQVGDNETSIITIASEWADQIDTERAQRALDRADKGLEEAKSMEDKEFNLSAKKRAQNRLTIAQTAK